MGSAARLGGCWDELAPLRADRSGVSGSHLSSPAVSGGLSGEGAQGDHPHQVPYIPGSRGRGWRCLWRGLGSSGQPWCLSAACRLSGPAHLLPGMLPITVVRQAHASPVLPHPPETMSWCPAPVVCTAASPARARQAPVTDSPASLIFSHKSVLFLE